MAYTEAMTALGSATQLAVRAFRVVKEHREPREWWLQLDDLGNLVGLSTSEPTDPFRTDEIVYVREVIE